MRVHPRGRLLIHGIGLSAGLGLADFQRDGPPQVIGLQLQQSVAMAAVAEMEAGTCWIPPQRTPDQLRAYEPLGRN